MSATRWRLSRVQVPLAFRGVSSCRPRSSSRRLTVESIQPKQIASSTISAYGQTGLSVADRHEHSQTPRAESWFASSQVLRVQPSASDPIRDTAAVPADRLPRTYDDGRTWFRDTAETNGLTVAPFGIGALGPSGETLTVDVVAIGAGRAVATERSRRALVVMSGVHGVEGFVGSALLSDFLARVNASELPDDMEVLLIHAVNPWGMAWGRRQNESNVDLNRNWQRDRDEPHHNDAYDELHPIACPDTPELPSIDEILIAAGGLVAERGLPWVRDAITSGQYRHRDGLHFGGERTEESTAIIERVAADRLAQTERLLVIDLHTGHGSWGEITCLSDEPPGSPQDTFLRGRLGADHVEATTGNSEATTGVKSGQIANGIRAMRSARGAEAYSTSLEVGTVSDDEQIVATILEQWVHRRGARHRPEYEAICQRYRECFTPDDPEWELAAMSAGRRHLQSAVTAVAEWA